MGPGAAWCLLLPGHSHCTGGGRPRGHSYIWSSHNPHSHQRTFPILSSHYSSSVAHSPKLVLSLHTSVVQAVDLVSELSYSCDRGGVEDWQPATAGFQFKLRLTGEPASPHHTVEKSLRLCTDCNVYLSKFLKKLISLKYKLYLFR